MRKNRSLIERGQAALVSVVIITVVSLFVATAISYLILSEFRMTQSAVNSDMAFNAAEGALNDLLVRIKKDTDWPSTPYSDSLTINNVVVNREVIGSKVKDITVTAEYKNITKLLKASYDTSYGNCDVFEIEP
jgi:Tfp pilus assembly protein PilX